MSDHSQSNSVADNIDIIQLIRSKNVGCINFSKAIKQFGSVARALEGLQENPKILGREITLCDRDLATKEYETGMRSGLKFLSYNMQDFPNSLAHIYECPPFLWAKGNLDILKKHHCAIVGARNASIGGRKIAFSLAKNLGLNQFVTVSGLALGIDTAAHQGSLQSGTIAVLASGLNVTYPSENEQLAADILHHNGLIVSEAPPNAPPQAKMFVKRNRIISALSLGTVIIEAAEKSGSLTTAEFALEQNKEIFSVPGSPLDPRASGTNRLLRSGAHWAENSDDVISVLQNLIQHQTLNTVITSPPQTNKQQFLHKKPKEAVTVEPIIVHTPQQKPKNSNADLNILDLLSTTPISCDDLIRLTGQSSAVLLPMLAMMELEGKITREHGNMITKVIKRI